MKLIHYLPVLSIGLLAGCKGSTPISIDFPGGTIGPGQICFEVPEEGSSFDRAFRAKCGVGLRLNLGASASSKLGAAGGANSIALDPSRSNLPVPVGTPVTVRLRNSSGAMIAERSFETVVVSGRFKASNPYEVDAFVAASGSAAVIADVEFGPFEVAQNEGENRMIVDARIGGNVAASQGRIWYLDKDKCDRGGTNGECNYQEP